MPEIGIRQTTKELIRLWERSNIIWRFGRGCSNRQSAVIRGRGFGQIVM